MTLAPVKSAMVTNVLVKKVLVVWEHGGGLGHLARLLPIMQTLRARGHDVVFAAARPELMVPVLVGTGITVVQAPQVQVGLRYDTAALCPADIWLRCGFASPPHAAVCVRQWLALFDVIKPASVLVDASPLALYAALVAGLPAVQLGNGFELPPALPGQSYSPWLDDVGAGIAHSELVLESAMAGLAGALAKDFRADTVTGLAVSRTVQAVQSLSIPALCTWPEMDHFDRVAESAEFIGPIWSDLPGGIAVTWPDKPGPKVLCSLGMTDNRYDLLWQALQMHGANVVVLSPSGIDGVCALARGWGVMVCQHAVAPGKLMAECDAVISHGGSGLTSTALHAGKAFMALPSHLEQGLLAYQLAQRGLAISSLRPFNKTQVQARVAQLLQDTELRKRVSDMSRRYAGYLPQQAVDRVADMLLGNATPTDFKVKSPERAECLPL